MGGGEKDDLTARVRALYEDSAVPVHAIAKLAGVTERTIYKYAAKGGWKPRHRRSPDVAPVKGAGGRFIRREDAGNPFARGLKATDPAAAARAAAACGEASRRASVAQVRAEALARHDALLRAIDWTNRTFADLARFRRERAANRKSKNANSKHAQRKPDGKSKDAMTRRVGGGSPRGFVAAQEPSKELPKPVAARRLSARRTSALDASLERLFVQQVEVALARWQALLGKEEGGRR